MLVANLMLHQIVWSVRVENYRNRDKLCTSTNLAGKCSCSMSVIILEGVPQNLSQGGGGRVRRGIFVMGNQFIAV